jgi:hypothetical protein
VAGHWCRCKHLHAEGCKVKVLRTSTFSRCSPRDQMTTGPAPSDAR